MTTTVEPQTVPQVDGRYTVAGRPAIVDAFTDTTVWYTVQHEGAEPTKHRTTRSTFANPVLVQPRD